MQRAVPKQELQTRCTEYYDPENVTYTVNATWNLTNQHPLVLEALLANEFWVNAIYFQTIMDPRIPASEQTELTSTFPQV